MFVSTTLIYPVVLALLSVGAGLLIDRCSGRFLQGALLPAVGGAGLIAVSQLCTYSKATAPATPYVVAAVGVVGFGVGWPRVRGLAGDWVGAAWGLGLPVVVYLIALAPVLLAGRPTFSSYGVLPDSAVHMIGADFLIHHGQDYARLDLGNSYGEYLSAYFNTSYPSGADTLFGASGLLLRLPLIWAFQPFCAFVIALAAGPAWLLVRRLGLGGFAAGVAAVTATLPAIVYGYVLVGSVKEIVALAMILTLGVLVADRPSWLGGRVTGGIPFAVVAAAGVSALGIGFGAWVLGAVVVLVGWLAVELAGGRLKVGRAAVVTVVGAVTTVVCAWPTWSDLSGSLNVAQGIAATSNPGNLKVPLRTEQIVGPWLVDSYRHQPLRGLPRDLTYALIVVTLLAAAFGIVILIRRRSYAIAGWVLGMLVIWGGLTAYGTTWVDAKVLMITAPVVMLLAWAGVAGLWRSSTSGGRCLGGLVGVVLVAGIGGSDALQYRASDLAPTARYEELAALNVRFAGRGPTLFTPFDEWSLYALRSMDVGGPDFVYPPAKLAGVVKAHGGEVNLDRIPPAAFAGYPLIVTGRDPRASRPPSAYRLIWQGTYYLVWGRRPGAPTAVAHIAFANGDKVGCRALARIAATAGRAGASLVAARRVERVSIDLEKLAFLGWDRYPVMSVGLVMTPFGHLTADFRVPQAGFWDVWLEGEIMPTITVKMDGRRLGTIAGEVSGSEFNPDTMTPLALRLGAGPHVLTVSRGGRSLAPGNGGSALLHAIFLTPAGAQEPLETASAGGWRSLCGQRYDWVEAVRGSY